MNRPTKTAMEETSLQTIDQPKPSQSRPSTETSIITTWNWMINKMSEGDDCSHRVLSHFSPRDCSSILDRVFDMFLRHGTSIEESFGHRLDNGAYTSATHVYGSPSAIGNLTDEITSREGEEIEGTRISNPKLWEITGIGLYDMRQLKRITSHIARQLQGNIRNHQIICRTLTREDGERQKMASIAMRVEVAPSQERQIGRINDEFRRMGGEQSWSIHCRPADE